MDGLHRMQVASQRHRTRRELVGARDERVAVTHQRTGRGCTCLQVCVLVPASVACAGAALRREPEDCRAARLSVRRDDRSSAHVAVHRRLVSLSTTECRRLPCLCALNLAAGGGEREEPKRAAGGYSSPPVKPRPEPRRARDVQRDHAGPLQVPVWMPQGERAGEARALRAQRPTVLSKAPRAGVRYP